MSSSLENLGTENRKFPPTPEFAAAANAKADMYGEAKADRLAFWEKQAHALHWDEPWTQVLDWKRPFAKWFIGGKLNASYNCLDRHVIEGRGDRVAFIFEGEPGDSRTYTYAQLLIEVKKTANALIELGVKDGDRVAIYMPMIPEAAIAMLACARIGAPHSVVFGGFSADALLSRIQDADAKIVITADGGYRKGSANALKPAVDDALKGETNVKHVLVVKRTEQNVEWNAERDVWWHEIVERQSAEHTAEAFDSEHGLFILYTSGTTAKPKGIYHTTGGYLTQAAFTHKNVFDLKPETDVYWCTADVGWITGHSYVVYGPLINGATQVIYEGTPDSPTKGRMFEIIEKHGVTILYTAPTLIRTWMKWGDEFPNASDLSSLRLLGSVGEPINPEAWMWYREVIGGNRCPIVDTWWQTETGGIMISNMAGITPGKPGWATYPMPGVKTILVDDKGAEVTTMEDGLYRGNLCITQPWPSTLRTTYGDHERCRTNYFATYENLYFTGDGALQNEQGQIRITGRVDDVLNVSGHRIGTAEVENAINMHAGVVESAVVGYPHDIKGQGIYAYVIYTGSHGQDTHGIADMVRKDILQTVTRIIGPIAKPDKIQFVSGLPKTRSGKIMRRILRKVAEGELKSLGDTSTLLDPAVVDEIVKGVL
jgi:acetyl-CoA synthetase